MREWTVSSFCAHGGCVAVERTGLGVYVLSTVDPAGTRVWFTHAEWSAFIAGVKAGEFDLPREVQ